MIEKLENVGGLTGYDLAAKINELIVAVNILIKGQPKQFEISHPYDTSLRRGHDR